jgi:hypothetical protein
MTRQVYEEDKCMKRQVYCEKMYNENEGRQKNW